MGVAWRSVQREGRYSAFFRYSFGCPWTGGSTRAAYRSSAAPCTSFSDLTWPIAMAELVRALASCGQNPIHHDPAQRCVVLADIQRTFDPGHMNACQAPRATSLSRTVSTPSRRGAASRDARAERAPGRPRATRSPRQRSEPRAVGLLRFGGQFDPETLRRHLDAPDGLLRAQIEQAKAAQAAQAHDELAPLRGKALAVLEKALDSGDVNAAKALLSKLVVSPGRRPAAGEPARARDLRRGRRAGDGDRSVGRRRRPRPQRQALS